MQLAREDLTHGLVVGGELREPELLAEELRSFFRKNRLPRQGVRLGIANNRIGVRTFEIAMPKMGMPPSLSNLPTGCAFRPRCERASALCRQEPEERAAGSGRRLRCFHPLLEAVS